MMLKSRRLFVILLAIALTLSGCSGQNTGRADGKYRSYTTAAKPTIPEKLETDADGIPVLTVYDVSAEKLEKMNLEEYVMGVVAGEMKNDWPIEALKAQAILARTFVLKFCDTKQSRYEGADISTDVAEAQAYAPQNINDRVQKAVEETRGIVMAADGDYPYAWFYAHAGGKTELPSVALDYNDNDPSYLSVTDSPDSEKAPENVKSWTVTFNENQIIAACREAGLKISSVEDVEIGERGASGRAKTLLINNQSISAPSFRIHIGANQLKSTLIDSVEEDDGTVTFSGRGYGHGVGMSQWGAYALAEEGKSAEEIVRHYFTGVDIVRLWK